MLIRKSFSQKLKSLKRREPVSPFFSDVLWDRKVPNCDRYIFRIDFTCSISTIVPVHIVLLSRVSSSSSSFGTTSPLMETVTWTWMLNNGGLGRLINLCLWLRNGHYLSTTQ